MTEQIVTKPKEWNVSRQFGPYMNRAVLPDDVLDAMIKMSDDIIGDKTTESHGQSLAGIIEKELRLYKSNMIEYGVDTFLESCVRSFVNECLKIQTETLKLKILSQVNAAWIVSQYENEYNPIHSHSNAEISGIIYLKVPNLKGRRKIESKKDMMDRDGNINFTYNSASNRWPTDILDGGGLEFFPNVGEMYMFPSFLEHTVYPFIGEGERRSIAFNAVYTVLDENGKFKYGRPAEHKMFRTHYLEGKPNK